MSNSETPWTAARLAFLSFTVSCSLLKFMSIESVMPSNHLIFRVDANSRQLELKYRTSSWCPLRTREFLDVENLPTPGSGVSSVHRGK